MFAYDFEFDGQYLSDFGMTICTFDNNGGIANASSGAKISFNKVSTSRGLRQMLTGTSYDECVSADFNICKDPERFEDMVITDDEFRDIVRWLNRHEFLPFRAIDEDQDRDTCYFNASFNIEKVKLDGDIVGLNLTMETDKPYGYGQEQSLSWVVKDPKQPYVLSDMSDEIGVTYPSMVITSNATGTLRLENLTEPCVMVLKNLTPGEIITIDGDTRIIKTSRAAHDLSKGDFNFEFFRFGNTYLNRNNKIVASLPCQIVFSYRPIIKNTPD